MEQAAAAAAVPSTSNPRAEQQHRQGGASAQQHRQEGGSVQQEVHGRQSGQERGPPQHQQQGRPPGPGPALPSQQQQYQQQHGAHQQPRGPAQHRPRARLPPAAGRGPRPPPSAGGSGRGGMAPSRYAVWLLQACQRARLPVAAGERPSCLCQLAAAAGEGGRQAGGGLPVQVCGIVTNWFLWQVQLAAVAGEGERQDGGVRWLSFVFCMSMSGAAWPLAAGAQGCWAGEKCFMLLAP